MLTCFVVGDLWTFQCIYFLDLFLEVTRPTQLVKTCRCKKACQASRNQSCSSPFMRLGRLLIRHITPLAVIIRPSTTQALILVIFYAGQTHYLLFPSGQLSGNSGNGSILPKGKLQHAWCLHKAVHWSLLKTHKC